MIEPLEARLPVNWQPLALDDWFVLDEDAPFAIESPGVLANDSDEDEDRLTAFLVDGPAFGDLTFNADGSFTYVPEANFHGQVTFTYRVFDGTDYSNIATVTLTINPINDDPFAVDDAFATDEDTPVILDVLANDSDVDGDNLSIVGFTNPGNGSVSQNPDGTLTYTPNAEWHGEDSFQYTVSDGQGGTATATATVFVSEGNDPGNDAPVAEEDDFITDEDTPITMSLVANDHDIDGDELEVISTTDPEHGSVAPAQDGDYTYTPDADWHGLDGFSYTISDGNGGNATADVYVLVNSVNDTPIAVDDNFTMPEDGGLSMDVIANDIDPADGDTLSIIDITTPAHGTVQYNDNGTITYQPNGDYHGADSFTYIAWDGFDGGEAIATVNLTITPVDDVPIAYHDIYWCEPRLTETPYWKEFNAPGVMANDIDYDYADAGYDFYGLQVDVENVNTSTLYGQLDIHPDGSFEFQPDVAVSGWSYFTYTIGDGQSASPPAQAWVYILPWDLETMQVPIGPPPPPYDLYANDDTYYFAKDDIGGSVATNDDEALTRFRLDAVPQYGRLLPENAEGFTLPSGSFTYHPDPNYVGLVPGLVHTTNAYVPTSIYYAAYTNLYQEAGAVVQLRQIHADLDIPSLTDDEMQEDMVGAVVVLPNNDPVYGWNNEPLPGNLPSVKETPREKILLRPVQGGQWNGNVILTRRDIGPDYRLNVFPQEFGGVPLTFNGADNKFSNPNLPAGGLELWVEGYNYSDKMGDTGLSFEAQGINGSADLVNFTVLHIEQPKIKFGNIWASADEITDTNEARPEFNLHEVAKPPTSKLGPRALYVGVSPTGQLGPPILGGWAHEIRAEVHPFEFRHPVVSLHLTRDVDAIGWEKLPDAATYVKLDQLQYSNVADVPEGNDTSEPKWRDDTPGDSVYIFDIDVPGNFEETRPQGTIRRLRFNARSMGVIEWKEQPSSPHRLARAGPCREYYIAFSVRQNAPGQGNYYVLIRDVAGDNKAEYGQLPELTWNLKPPPDQ